MSAYDVKLIGIARLKPSEMVDAAHVSELARAMLSAGVQEQPILVERDSLVILDGHHRFHAARTLGLESIAAILIDYDDERLTLSSWTEREFTREDVLGAAGSGKLLPLKSTRHRLSPVPHCEPVALTMLVKSEATYSA